MNFGNAEMNFMQGRWERYDAYFEKESEPSKEMLFKGEHIIEEAGEQERLNEEHLTQQIAQVKIRTRDH